MKIEHVAAIQSAEILLDDPEISRLTHDGEDIGLGEGRDDAEFDELDDDLVDILAGA